MGIQSENSVSTPVRAKWLAEMNLKMADKTAVCVIVLFCVYSIHVGSFID